MRTIIICLITCLVYVSCQKPDNINSLGELPPVYPDYIDVTIPVNIAPLNFMIQNEADKIVVTILGKNDSIVVKGRNSINIPENKWHEILLNNQDKSISINVIAKVNNEWIKYLPFKIHVKSDTIDPCLSYRLIEPGYEVWNKIEIVERHLDSFKEHIIADNNLTNRSCMNCHISANNSSSFSMFHVRGEHGGTILNENGKLRKINTRVKGMVSAAVYGNFHPSGKYAVFSTNVVVPGFHSLRSERLEVYDSASDLVVIDFDNNKLITQPFLSDTSAFETFPVFSACGQRIYYCIAHSLPLPDSIKSLKYSICSVSFNTTTGEIGTQVDTLWNADRMGGSASHLKTSPDGRYILFTVADYGTFPIWHREADLQMMNLSTGEIDQLKNVNGPCSDTYHSWSSNSRWFVFASKRDDGIYGKPYFCYIDSTGKSYKPFLLPQKNPQRYINSLKSFNIPELSVKPVPFTALDVERIYNNVNSEQIDYFRE